MIKAAHSPDFSFPADAGTFKCYQGSCSEHAANFHPHPPQPCTFLPHQQGGQVFCTKRSTTTPTLAATVMLLCQIILLHLHLTETTLYVHVATHLTFSPFFLIFGSFYSELNWQFSNFCHYCLLLDFGDIVCKCLMIIIKTIITIIRRRIIHNIININTYLIFGVS